MAKGFNGIRFIPAWPGQVAAAEGRKTKKQINKIKTDSEKVTKSKIKYIWK